MECKKPVSDLSGRIFAHPKAPARETEGSYRPEIDGLRAFAVIAVIINHLNKDILPSGYLGVDIFFVISGYVITKSLDGRRSNDLGDFIAGFYERRIKRLVPALAFFVVITSILICLFNQTPSEELGTGLSSLFGFSNIYLFLRSTNYFAQATELNPFTHTWSLGVEEQFYLVFPFLVWFSGFARQAKDGSKNLLLLISLAAIPSLLGFIYFYQENQSAAYFLMPFRFWEMAAGSVTFLALGNSVTIRKALLRIPPSLALMGICGVMYLPLSAAVPATISVAALSMLLISCLHQGTSIYKILTQKEIVYIGLLSYSLYLWHWGALATMKVTIGISRFTVPIFIALTVIPAIASYEIIEKRTRKQNWSTSRPKTIGIGLFSLTGCAAFVLLLQSGLDRYLFAGSKRQKPNYQTAAKSYKGEYSGRNSQSCQNIIGTGISTRALLEKCSTKKPAEAKTARIIIFTGDSHSGMLMPLSEMLYHNDQVQTADFFNDGCTIPELDIASGKCTYMNEQVLQISRRLGQRAIFVISSNFIGPDNFIRETTALAERVTSHGSSLIVIMPNPTYPALSKGELVDKDLCQVQWYRPSFALGSQCANGFRVNRKDIFENRERNYYLASLKKYARRNPRFYVYDPFDDLCVRDTPIDKSCSPIKGRTLLYYDDNHLNIDGAKALYPRFRKFLAANNLIKLRD